MGNRNIIAVDKQISGYMVHHVYFVRYIGLRPCTVLQYRTECSRTKLPSN